jgi:hypothetical protein
MLTFDMTSRIDPRQLHLNTSSPARWRRLLLGACLALSVFGGYQAHEHLRHDPASPPPAVTSPTTLMPQVDLDKIFTQAAGKDEIHAQVAASTVYLVQFTAQGRFLQSGTGTMLAGTDRDGMLQGISVRHVVDVPNMFGDADDRREFGPTLVFNSAGRLLGVMAPDVVNLPVPGTNLHAGDDAPTLFRIDPRLPHDADLLSKIPGVPLYPQLPTGELQARYGGLAVAPGASGGGIIYVNSKTGQWGLVGVISGRLSGRPNEVSLTTGHSMYGKISGVPTIIGHDERPGRGDLNIVLGVGNPALLAQMQNAQAYRLTVRPDFSAGQAFSFNFASNMPDYNDKIDLTTLAKPYNYATWVVRGQHEFKTLLSDPILLGFAAPSMLEIVAHNSPGLAPGSLTPGPVTVHEDDPTP